MEDSNGSKTWKFQNHVAPYPIGFMGRLYIYLEKKHKKIKQMHVNIPYMDPMRYGATSVNSKPSLDQKRIQKINEY